MTGAKTAPPLLVTWELTRACNLRCAHCFRAESLEDARKHEPSTSDCFRIIERLSKPYQPILFLSGGEPLLRPDACLIARQAADSGLEVVLATNGALIDEDMARRLRESGVERVSVTLEGGTAETHERRRQPGTLEKAVAALRILRRLAMPVEIAYAVRADNWGELEAAYQLASSLDAEAFHVYALHGACAGGPPPPADRLTFKQYQGVLDWLEKMDREGSIIVAADCAPPYGPRSGSPPPEPAPSLSTLLGLWKRPLPVAVHIDFRRFTITSEFAGERSEPRPRLRRRLDQARLALRPAIGTCFISNEGQVTPCRDLPVPAGNILDKPFEEIWENAPVFQDLRERRLKGKCGRCELKDTCGGCRTLAWEVAGDYLAEDPFCQYEPAAEAAPKA